MKTKNRFQKAVATMAALGLTLVLLTHSAEGQGFGKASDNNEGKTRKSSETVATQSAASFAAELAARKYVYVNMEIVEGSDPELHFENWMFDSRNFVPVQIKKTTVDSTANQEAEVSESLVNKMPELLIVEAEEPLKLESWMKDDKCFRCETKTNTGGLYSENLRAK